MVTVNKCGNITPKEVKGKISQGYDIFATPHIGNIHRYGLAISETGAPLVLVDVNIPAKDDIAYPANIIKNNISYILAENQDQITSPFLKINKNGLNIKNIDLSIDKNLGNIHYNTLKKIFPQTYTTSEYLYLLDPTIIKVLEILISKSIPLFNKYLKKDGKMTEDKSISYNNKKAINECIDTMKNKTDIVKSGIYNIKEGPVPSLNLNIFIHIMKILFTQINNGTTKCSDETAELYTYSGKTMINYIMYPDIIEFLNTSYKILLESKEFEIPSSVRLNMIPGYALRNMPIIEETEKIDAMNKIANICLELQNLDTKIRTSNNNPSLIAQKIELSKIKSKTNKESKEILAKDNPRITQYDDNNKVIIPTSVQDINLNEIEKLFNIRK